MAVRWLNGKSPADGARSRVALLLALVCAAAFPGLAAADAEAPPDVLRSEVRLLERSGRTSYSEVDIGAPALVAAIYAGRGYSPFWADASRRLAAAETVRASAADGLDPGDYHLTSIDRVLETESSGRQLTLQGAAVFDLLLTDGIVRLAHDLRYGKLTGGWPDAGSGVDVPAGEDVLSALSALLDADALPSAMLDWLPRSQRYLRLRAALTRYRAIAERGGWPVVPAGPTIRPGDEDPRLRTLAERLYISGDHEVPEAEKPTYGPALEAAVRRFQLRHGIAADGEIGGATLRALNVPVASRVNQLRVNLERERWPRRPGPPDRLVVNIPAYRADLFRDGAPAWSLRAIVGEPDTPTPTLESAIHAVVLNPTWTVPYSIASGELLPDIQADPGILERGGYGVLDRNGARVDPAGIDWYVLGPDRFPYTLVQQPGPANALGRVKFVFVNDHGVRMHDTPARQLFSQLQRALSHGCIRVEEPAELAARLASGEGWTRDRIEEALDTLETRSIFLSNPVALSVIYRTAEVDDSGMVHFHADIYDQDPAVLAALERESRSR